MIVNTISKGDITMRKTQVIAALTAVTLMMTACGKIGSEKVNITPSVAKNFTSTATLDYNDTQAEAVITRIDSGLWQAEFTAPKTLSGITLIFDKDNVSANYKGLAFSVPKAAMPFKTILSDFISVADEVAQSPKIEAEKAGDAYAISGANEQGEYTLTLDKSGNQITGFSVPNIALNIAFTDFTATKGDITTAAPTESAVNEVTTAPAESAANDVTTTVPNAENVNIDAEEMG